MNLAFRLLVTLSVLWLAMSGLFKPQLLILGALSVALVVWLSKYMRVLQHRGEPIYFRFFHILSYWAWLIKQIFLSNVEVTRRVLSRNMDISPTLRRVTATPEGAMGLMPIDIVVFQGRLDASFARR